MFSGSFLGTAGVDSDDWQKHQVVPGGVQAQLGQGLFLQSFPTDQLKCRNLMKKPFVLNPQNNTIAIRNQGFLDQALISLSRAECGHFSVPVQTLYIMSQYILFDFAAFGIVFCIL